MPEPLLLALDQGTSSSRAVLFNIEGELIASAQVPLGIHYPADGWVEQDASALWESQLQALRELELAITEEQRRSVCACGVTNQRETTVLWSRRDGAHLAPALVWQDRRTAAICEHWKHHPLAETWQERTGLVLDPYFSASKIRWLLDHSSAAATASQAGDLCFGTVDSWLLWQLSAGTCHGTDHSNASRTLLLDLHTLEWWPEAVELAGLPLHALPELKTSAGPFTRIASGLPFEGVPITAVLGDQQAATFGQHCGAIGQAKCTYGTGAFLVVNSGPKPVRASGGLLATVGWTEASGSTTYCLEGSLFNAGTVIQWLRDGLGLIESADQIDQLARSVETAGDLMLVPAFTGWGTPHWDPTARGLMIGLTRDSSAGHLARAALDGIALAVDGLVQAAEQALGQPLQELAVDGGACASDVLLQAQADSSGRPVRRPAQRESTALGVALMAGQAAGVVGSLEAVRERRLEGASLFVSRISAERRQLWRQRWDEAVRRCLHWHGDATL
jgi:glycerol kinase